ncbi:MAG: hypothetical protein JJ879_10640 [Sneathiella sp.]|nr:hypothetical protein [Sneathiella sp.]
MSYAAIKTALEQQLQSAADIPVVFDDSRYRKKPKTAFLRAIFKPEKVQSRLIGAAAPAEYQGALEVLIFEASHMAAVVRADDLRGAFPKGLLLEQGGVRVSITGADLVRDQQSLNHNVYRLRIRWRSYF